MLERKEPGQHDQAWRQALPLPAPPAQPSPPEAQEAHPPVGGGFLGEEQQRRIASVGGVGLQGLQELCSASRAPHLQEATGPANEARGPIQHGLLGERGEEILRPKRCPTLGLQEQAAQASMMGSSPKTADAPVAAQRPRPAPQGGEGG